MYQFSNRKSATRYVKQGDDAFQVEAEGQTQVRGEGGGKIEDEESRERQWSKASLQATEWRNAPDRRTAQVHARLQAAKTSNEGDQLRDGTTLSECYPERRIKDSNKDDYNENRAWLSQQSVH